MSFDLRQLRHVVAVAELRSFSRAAATLNITQPALSRSIALFEAECGVQLFDRNRRGLTETVLGAGIIAEAQGLLAHAERFDLALRRRIDAQSGSIALGAGPLAAEMLLPGLLSRFAQDRPAVQIDTIIDKASALFLQLRRGRIELCLVSRSVVPPDADFVIRRAANVRLAFLVRIGHPLAGLPGLGLSDLAAYPIAMSATRSDTYFQSGAELQAPAPTITCENFTVLEKVTRTSDSIWISSPDLLTHDTPLVPLDVIEWRSARQDLCVVHPANVTLSPLAEAVMAELISSNTEVGEVC